MNTATLNKETEKAVNISFGVEIYGECFTIKNVWFPKSMISIEKREEDKISFSVKNDWFLDKKVKEYCQAIVERGYNVKHEIKTYLSRINNVVIDWCYAKNE